MTNAATITRELLNERQRIEIPAALFGHQFSLRLEPCIFDMAGMLSKDYSGGLWDFYALDNGGFYMSAQSTAWRETLRVSSQNGFEGRMSADALGICACLYAYSHLSFGGGDFGDVCGEQIHRLRELAVEHAEARGILAAID